MSFCMILIGLSKILRCILIGLLNGSALTDWSEIRIVTMQKVVLVVLLLVAAAFAQAEVSKDVAPSQQIVAAFLKCTQNKNECTENVAQLRKYWPWLPPSIQNEILNQVISQLSSQFPRVPYETMVTLVRNFINDKVPAQEACDFAWKIISEEVRRREECVEKCVNDNLSIEKLFAAIAKCKLDFRCYLGEVENTLEGLALCIRDCLMKRPQLA